MKSILVLFLIGFSVVLSKPQGTSSGQEYSYNVTVIIPDNNNDRQEGKLYLVLEGNAFQHEIQLTPHSTPLRPGNPYSYYVSAPFPIERVDSVLLSWKKKRFSNLLGSSVLHVKGVILEPAYLAAGLTRTSSTKKYCADQDPVEMTSEVKYKFWVTCGF